MKHELDFENFYDVKAISSSIFGLIQSGKNLKTLDKLYTIKTLDSSSTKSENLIKNEINLWEKLSTIEMKPRAIPIFTGFSRNTKKNQYNLIFEIPPKNLKDVIDEMKSKIPGDALSFYQLKSFFESLIKSFAFLQTMKICHQDLKPANLFLDQSTNQIYLIDLTLSKDLIINSSPEIKKQLTIAGSSFYFPPEVDNAINNSNSAGKINLHKSDVFSLALIFLELGTLQVPTKVFGVSQWKEAIDNLLKRFGEIYKDVINKEDKQSLEEFIKVLKSCLNFNSDERPDFIELFLGSMKGIENEKLRLHILLDEEILNLENLKNIEKLGGKDFSFIGKSKDNKIEVKIWGKALNFIEKDTFLDEE